MTKVTQERPGTTTLAEPIEVQPFQPMMEMGLTELIGADEQVDQYEYCASVAVALGATMSGEILSIALYATEAGTGEIITEAGVLLVMDADPTVAAGDAHLASAEWATILGKVAVDATDWFEENANPTGAVVYKTCTPIPFHALSTLYFVYYHEGATTWNSASGDEELLQVNGWIRRDS